MIEAGSLTRSIMRAGKFANADLLRSIASFDWTKLGLMPFMRFTAPERT